MPGAINLDATDRFEEARAHLDAMIKANPKDMDAVIALARIQHARKMFDACAGTYGQAIDLVPKVFPLDRPPPR